MLDDATIALHRQELRRGTASLACLTLLAASPDYGYSLLDRLAGLGLEIEANTLYPLLRRLEKQSLLEHDWDTTEARPRKFYKTSAEGLELLNILRRDWAALGDAMNQIGDLS
jgi:PadR family transcriptional regulator PadR